LALLSGVYSLIRFKVIEFKQLSGKLYLVCTLIAAVTALTIYRHGGFGPAHGLAVLTLLALLFGFVAEKTAVFGKLSAYIQATCFSATFLFHMIPAITDGLMRLPVDAPIVTSIKDPLLKSFFLAFLVTYIIGLGLQVLWLRRQPLASHRAI
ncbi:MAG: putative membrane protein, partial [Alteromonadaceae bacterium]